MKTCAVVFLSVVILWCNMEVDAGSFNLSGSFDPGISFGRFYRVQQVRDVEDNDDDFDWPQPNHINNFEEPESINDPSPYDIGPNDNERL